MAARSDLDEAPEAFRTALAALRGVTARREVTLAEAPAPQRLAPYAVALTADVTLDGDDVGTGRLVLLHDPAGHETWQGTFRLVTFVRADLDPEMASDPLLASVGWTWLLESLDQRGLGYLAPSGTVTRVASESFGTLAGRPASADIEIRASWTPTVPGTDPAASGRSAPDVAGHVQAWCDLLCMTAGLPPLPSGVAVLPDRRGRRH